MGLLNQISIARRFQRSIRIDTDLRTPEALEGFICTRSSADVLCSMAHHIEETNQGAFTWTGPYGSGKSSLVIVLSALLSGNKKLQDSAAKIVSPDVTSEIQAILPIGNKGWQVLPIVGRREQPVHVFGDALEAFGYKKPNKNHPWTEESVLSAIVSIANEDPEYGGLVVFIDEMGKFLEAASYDNTDIYLFQQLAEFASRSNKRLIIIGILHQSFAEYASRLSRDMRDEWSKIQGRFIDLPINSAGEEQIELISRAIVNNNPNRDLKTLAQKVADIVYREKAIAAKHLSRILEDCWPLHPVVSCLLGPISRRRFGQNQRSIFGFLVSGEPQGFQDYLQNASESTLFEPYRLWDYLRINLEPAILASPDGHRWALAAEAIERCDVIGGGVLDIRVLKTIALIDLFKERSGLSPSLELLCSCFHGIESSEIEQTTQRLINWSFIIFRKFTNAFSVYAGSDFNIDQAVESALEQTQEVDFTELRNLAGIQPILAKRYYHETGSLWWFDVEAIPLNSLEEVIANFTPRPGVIGQFLLVIPSEGESKHLVESACEQIAQNEYTCEVVVGSSPRTWHITSLAKELLATEKVLNDSVELSGDAVARREVKARLTSLQGRLEAELNQTFAKATWYVRGNNPRELHYSELNSLASDFAKKKFKNAPRIFNELLNRIKPSSNAIAAQNSLLRHMVMHEGKERLDIQGYPAERGLFTSLLEATQIYQFVDSQWQFISPSQDSSSNLYPMWENARSYLRLNSDRSVSVGELYSLWQGEGLGVKEGLLPILSVAFILSEQRNLAFYRQGIFLPKLRDIDVEYLAKDANEIQLRWMDLSDSSRKLLSEMASIVRQYDCSNELRNLEPIDVARGLIAIFSRLKPWAMRTTRLSQNATRIRTLFKKANDPNRFLFNDIPAIFITDSKPTTDTDIENIVAGVSEGLNELLEAYPLLLSKLQETLFAELQVPNSSPSTLAELRSRAENIKQTTGDYRVEALIGRLAHYSGVEDDIEGIASLAINKPVRDWIDADIDRATLELSDLAQKFIRAEAYAHVKGRQDKRHAIAVVVGIKGRPTPIQKEFEITDNEQKEAIAIMAKLQKVLDGNKYNSNIILTALAELSARYIRTE